LEKRSIWETEVRITDKNYFFLKENLNDIVAQIDLKYGLKERDFYSVIDCLSDEIAKLRGKSFKDVEKELSLIGIAFGEAIVRQYDGRWYWLDEFDGIMIKPISNRVISVSPVLAVFHEWQSIDTMRNEIVKLENKIQCTDVIPKHLRKYWEK